MDRTRFATGTPERTHEQMEQLAENVLPRLAPDPLFRSEYADLPPHPDVLSPVERLEFYIGEGAAAVLESRSGWPGAVRGFARPGAKVDMWDREATLSSLPIVAITPEHYNRMYRVRRREVPVTIELEVRNRHGEAAREARNVLGEIAGSDLAHELVMLGAHFDTWHASPNASDNSSGVAVMLEAMRILKAVGAEPRRTIRIALWSGEEQGIFGSRAYVKRHFGDPDNPETGTKPGYDNFSAYFNQDYGPGRYRGVWLQENEHVRPLFEAWMAPFHDFGMTTLAPASVGSTDHVAFDDAGLPGFQFLQARVGRNRRPHEPRLLRHPAGRRPQEERGGGGGVRVPRRDGRREAAPEGAEVGGGASRHAERRRVVRGPAARCAGRRPAFPAVARF